MNFLTVSSQILFSETLAIRILNKVFLFFFFPIKEIFFIKLKGFNQGGVLTLVSPIAKQAITFLFRAPPTISIFLCCILLADLNPRAPFSCSAPSRVQASSSTIQPFLHLQSLMQDYHYYFTNKNLQATLNSSLESPQVLRFHFKIIYLPYYNAKFVQDIECPWHLWELMLV